MTDRTPERLRSDRAIVEELDEIKTRVAIHVQNIRKLDEVFRSRIGDEDEERVLSADQRRC